MTATIDFEPPGPGTWEHDASHSPAAPTPVFRHVAAVSATTAYRDVFERFGAPLQTLDVRFVHGQMYRRMVPLVGADRSGPPPPGPVLWLAARLHPAFRARERVARRELEVKSFLEPMDDWERHERQAWIDRNLALQGEAIDRLDDVALADHVTRVVAHNLEGWTRHHVLHGTDMGPIGDLLAHTNRWGLDPVEVMEQLRGASPATVETARLAAGISEALRAAGVDPAAVSDLDEVRSASSDAAIRLDEYLERFGWRIVTSYDIEGLTVGELPGATVALIRAGGHAELDRPPVGPLRAAVPADDRADFDELLTNARRAYGLRDDNGPLTAEWPMGLIRRAFLEAGDRLAASGRISDAAHVFELDGDELASMLGEGSAPSADELGERADRRRWEAALDAPAVLGPDVAPPPSSLLPPGMRRMVEAVETAVELLEPERVDRPALHGLGLGEEPVIGRARVAHRPEDVLATFEPGDVLVAAWTAPTYNTVLAAAGGIVVQEGGLLCHAAVMARELDLPAVIGATDAMSAISDGDIVEVDPVRGVVRIVEAAG
ncbi:MAG: PEP-utilizing enzyme [Actinomycetota bacterium]